MTSITGVCSCAASAASWSSVQSQRHSLRADECGDDWEEEGRVRRQAVALRASASKSWAFFSSEPASSSARCLHVEQQWQKYDPTGEWDWMAYLCCGISAAVTNAAVTMVVANWWIKIDAQTTGGLCVATMLLTMWLYRTPPEDIALPLGKKAAKAAAADDVDIISTLASDANPNPGAAKRATKSPKRDKAALRFHE